MSTLLLAMMMGSADPTLIHSVRIDHAAGPVDAVYRATLDVRIRQVGAVSPPGAPKTLRCQWSANALVTRDARHAGGSLRRELRHADVLTGSRAGGCAGQRDAILAEAATRHDAVRARLAEAAAHDRTALHAELDKLPQAPTAG